MDDPPENRCPVCRWPVTTGGTSCVTCGRRAVGTAHQLLPAQRRWDLRAAHLAAAGDESIVEKLADGIRGGRPPYAEIIDAGLALGRPDTDNARALSVVADLLAGLVIGELQAVAFLCLRPDGFEVHTADVNAFKTTRIKELDQQWQWLDLAHELPIDVEQRHFVLAGGIGHQQGEGSAADRYGEPVEVLNAVARALPDLNLVRGTAVVLVNGCPGWILLGKIAELAARRYQLAATIEHPLAGSARALIEALIRQAPLGHAHEVVLLSPDATGQVYLRPRVVLPAGERSGATGEIEVYAPVGAHGPVSLALIVREPGSQPSEWRPVKLASAEIPRGTCARIGVTFDACAEAVFSGVPIARERRSWRTLLKGIPRQLPERRIDVVFAIESVAGPHAVARLALVQDAIAALDSEAGRAGWVRVGLAVYGQHDNTANPGDAVETTDLAEPRVARTRADAITLMQNADDFAAAVEDALAFTVHRVWRPGAERVLVTVGSRPPYRPAQGTDRARPCTAGHDWQTQIVRLDDAGVRRISVWTDPQWAPLDRVDEPIAERSDIAWAALGQASSIPFPDATVELLLERIGAGFITANTPFPYAAAEPRRRV